MSEQLRIMAIVCHPADALDHAGGTLCLHAERGDEVTVVVCTHGVETHDLARNESLSRGDDDIADLEKAIEGKEQEVHEVTSLAINLFRVLMTYLKPVLPEMAKQSEVFLNIDSLNWSDVKSPLTSHQINKFKPLMTRIEDDQIEAMIESSKV